ncbi:MAG: hypothetical protein A4E56_01907 [Pelotomaculum sp. PtaU1.Bin065]|nr:MAG: hypothetical protein A4E56_01907 [Pelotomaculum sp. PtaU1.Bin065]
MKEKDKSAGAMLRELARYKSCLGSLTCSGNAFAQKHFNAIQNMDTDEQYEYLKKLFDEIGCQ